MKFGWMALLLIFLGGCGFEVVNTGHRGVKTTFGEVDEKIGSMPEGLYFYNPFSSKIIELDTRMQRKEGATNTYTRDVQQANIKFVVNYRLEPAAAHTVFKEVGRNYEEVLIPQAVEGVLKQVIGTYDAVDLISNRQAATLKAQQAIADSLKAKHVTVDRFEMVDITYLKEFEKAVEDKVVAVQKAIEERNRTEQIQETAKQQIITAKAQAESMRIRANALQQNAKLVEYEAVQKWNGELPTYMMGNAVPFINVGGAK